MSHPWMRGLKAWLLLGVGATAGCATQEVPEGGGRGHIASMPSSASGSSAPACHEFASTPTEELAGTGISLGDTAYNFELMDQHGAAVSLYDFHGCVVVLDLVTEWCAPCQDAAPSLEVLHQERSPDVVVVAVMLQTADGGPPGLAHVQWWADTFGLTHPVLADPYASQYNYTGGSFPTVVVLDRDMVIAHEDWEIEDLEFLDWLL